jgi:hypothetical protein
VPRRRIDQKWTTLNLIPAKDFVVGGFGDPWPLI